MQVVNCTVAIAGDMRNTVAKENITVAELIILRELHGHDAVRNIQVVGKASVDSHEERERLAGIYAKPPTIVRDVLGATGPVPKTLKEAGIDNEFVIDAPEDGGGRKKASAAQAMKVTDPAEGGAGGDAE